MIAMELKPMDEILQMLEGYQKIVLFGDSGCAQMCEVGGYLQLEDMDDLLTSHGKTVLGYIFVEGGVCDGNALRRTIADKQDMLDEADAFLIQACGVGTQMVTETFPSKEAFPATNSEFLGSMPEQSQHYERCSMCGDCILHLTGGICPITRCAKGLLNGPCGGSMNGKCAVNPNQDCAWQLIYDRLKALGKLDNIRKMWGLRDWSPTHRPRKIEHQENVV
ncbi:MAG: methylenetetrahydrofolate reductase C-terminal domain-containing protein [Candidatus Thorarchaeota archaeon]